jgi:DNA-binding NarL/FixJ family response regulator
MNKVLQKNKISLSLEPIFIMKAVVVEDFKLIADVWAGLLKDSGFNSIEVFRHSNEVIEGVTRIQPDLIFMDINLPGDKNGIELTEELLQLFPLIKIIILTIHTEPTYVQRAFQAGASGFITKNSSISEIRKGILEVLAGKTYTCMEIVNK